MFEVYCHTSPSGKRYVGYSQHSMGVRWDQHVREAGSGGDRLICRAIRKYGADAFRHELLARCDTRGGACVSEQYWINALATMAPLGYNATAGGEGVSPAPHVLAKLIGNKRGEGNRGVKRTAEMRAAMSLRNIGKKLSPESIAKRSAKQRGQPRTYSAESRAAINAAVALANTRRIWTDASRAAQAQKSRGRKHTEDERQRMSAAWTPEMRKAASDRMRARKASK